MSTKAQRSHAKIIEKNSQEGNKWRLWKWGFSITTKGTVTVNHWNCHWTRRNPAWDTPSDGENVWTFCLSKPAAGNLSQVSVTEKPQNSHLEAQRLLWVPQCRSIHSPSHPSGFRCSQRNPLLSWAQPYLSDPELRDMQSGAPIAAIPHKPSLGKRSSKKKKKKKVFVSFLICTHSVLPKAPY